MDTLAKTMVDGGYRVVRPEPRGFGESVGPIEGVDLRDIVADVAAAIEATSAKPRVIDKFPGNNGRCLQAEGSKL